MLEQGFPWLTTLIVVPLVGAATIWLLPAVGRRWARQVAVAASLLTVAAAVPATLAFDAGSSGQFQLSERAGWIPSFGISYALGVNGIGLVLVLLCVVLVPLVLLAAWREPDTSPLRHYLALVLVLEALLVAVFSARDLFLFYVLFEAMLVPVYFMIGVFGGPQRRYAAVKFLIYSLAGGLVMLVGVIALYQAGPGGPQGFLIENLSGLDLSVTTGRLLFASFFLAFAIKAPIWPLHTWLPDVAEQAPAGTSALVVGVLDKVGTFGMLTLCLPLFPEASRWAGPAIVVLAVISILYGAFLAIGQENLLRLVAYSSISHFGFIVLGIFAFTSVSSQGAALYMLTHGLSTGALFLIAGFLVSRWGTARIADFGGLAKVVPVLAGVFLVAGLSALSLPGLAPFVSELEVLVGTFAANGPAAVVATLGVLLAALYVLLAYQRIFTGGVREGLAVHPDLSARERWVVGPLIAATLVFGLYPAPLVDLLRDPATAAVAQVGVQDAATVHPGDGSDR